VTADCPAGRGAGVACPPFEVSSSCPDRGVVTASGTAVHFSLEQPVGGAAAAKGVLERRFCSWGCIFWQNLETTIF